MPASPPPKHLTKDRLVLSRQFIFVNLGDPCDLAHFRRFVQSSDGNVYRLGIDDPLPAPGGAGHPQALCASQDNQECELRTMAGEQRCYGMGLPPHPTMHVPHEATHQGIAHSSGPRQAAKYPIA